MAQILLVVGDFVLAVNELSEPTDGGGHQVKFKDMAHGLQFPRASEAAAPFTATVETEMDALDTVKYWLMLDGDHDYEARMWLIEKFGEEAMKGYMP